jgi:predicted  nucleic acid-binding Zn-ribbon protein
MLWECVDCTTRYSVGAPRCPNCGATRYRVADSDPEVLGDTAAEVPGDEPAADEVEEQ